MVAAAATSKIDWQLTSSAFMHRDNCLFLLLFFLFELNLDQVFDSNNGTLGTRRRGFWTTYLLSIT